MVPHQRLAADCELRIADRQQRATLDATDDFRFQSSNRPVHEALESSFWPDVPPARTDDALESFFRPDVATARADEVARIVLLTGRGNCAC
jgi:hypothetical protein